MWIDKNQSNDKLSREKIKYTFIKGLSFYDRTS